MFTEQTFLHHLNLGVHSKDIQNSGNLFLGTGTGLPLCLHVYVCVLSDTVYVPVYICISKFAYLVSFNTSLWDLRGKVCVFLSIFIPFWQYPACSCLPATVWSSSVCSSDWPCCATSCPPTFCGRYWPAAAQCHKCSGWWSRKGRNYRKAHRKKENETMLNTGNVAKNKKLTIFMRSKQAMSCLHSLQLGTMNHYRPADISSKWKKYSKPLHAEMLSKLNAILAFISISTLIKKEKMSSFALQLASFPSLYLSGSLWTNIMQYVPFTCSALTWSFHLKHGSLFCSNCITFAHVHSYLQTHTEEKL